MYDDLMVVVYWLLVCGPAGLGVSILWWEHCRGG